MAQLVKITGVKQVIANLRRRHATLGLKTASGLKAAGLLLQRESQKLVPVDTGNLKASAFTRSSGAGWGIRVNVGYTAEYAIYVHEAVNMVLKGKERTGKDSKGHYWDPQNKAQAKFLEEPARRLAPEMRAIIKRFSRV